MAQSDMFACHVDKECIVLVSFTCQLDTHCRLTRERVLMRNFLGQVGLWICLWKGCLEF